MNAREGIAAHYSVQVFEGFAGVMRRLGAPEASCTKVGHYAALREAGVDRERALTLAGIERPADVPETSAPVPAPTRQAQGQEPCRR